MHYSSWKIGVAVALGLFASAGSANAAPCNVVDSVEIGGTVYFECENPDGPCNRRYQQKQCEGAALTEADAAPNKEVLQGICRVIAGRRYCSP
jgi:hypothetical protein